MSSSQHIAAVDPRIQRTRQLLQRSLEKLLAEKEFDAISVHDITEKATVNRATFYDHYPDKFSLLQCLVATRFRELLEKHDIRFKGCEGAIRAIATGVCTYLNEMPSGCSAQNRQSGQLLETAIVGVVREMMLQGLKSHRPKKSASLEVLASAAAWAIYGAAKEWMLTPNRVSVDRIAKTIDAMVSPMLATAMA